MQKSVNRKITQANHDDKQHCFLVLQDEMDATPNLRRIHPILDKSESSPRPAQYGVLPIGFPSMGRDHMTPRLSVSLTLLGS